MNNAANDTFAARSVSTPMLDLKIALDVVGSIVLLAFFSLLMIIIYATLMLRGGKPIYADRRVGKDGKIFHCYKFRSMVKDADKVLARHLETDAAARADRASA